MDPRAAAQRLADLRAQRSRNLDPHSLAPTFKNLAASLRRDAKRFATVAESWEALCPPRLRDRTAIKSHARSILTIAVADSATSYELDRWLRAQGENALINASSAPIRRIKLVLDASILPDTTHNP